MKKICKERSTYINRGIKGPNGAEFHSLKAKRRTSHLTIPEAVQGPGERGLGKRMALTQPGFGRPNRNPSSPLTQSRHKRRGKHLSHSFHKGEQWKGRQARWSTYQVLEVGGIGDACMTKIHLDCCQREKQEAEVWRSDEINRSRLTIPDSRSWQRGGVVLDLGANDAGIRGA